MFSPNVTLFMIIIIIVGSGASVLQSAWWRCGFLPNTDFVSRRTKQTLPFGGSVCERNTYQINFWSNIFLIDQTHCFSQRRTWWS